MRVLTRPIIVSTPLLTAAPHSAAEPPLLPQPTSATQSESRSSVFMGRTLPPTGRFGALQDRIRAALADRAELRLGIARQLAPVLRNVRVDRLERRARVLGERRARVELVERGAPLTTRRR